MWDEPKRLSNLDKHGFDFADLTIELFENPVVAPARDGRFVAIGRMADGTLAVVFATRGTEAISVISMRTASLKERRLLR